MSRQDYDRLTAQGLDVETVGDILGRAEPVAPVLPPVLPDAQPFPAPGIYFDMPESTYHAIHAGSSSGLKKLSTSSMDYWAESVLNPAKEETDNKYLELGKAYHKRIVEGKAAFDAAYAVQIEQRGIEGLLQSSDEIKAAIVAAGHKPCTRGFDDNTRAAKKADWIEQLLTIDPDAKVWDRIVEDHAKACEGRATISVKTHLRVEIAAKMIESHPELSHVFRKGHAEVSFFWFCPVTGCPMKARVDYLKLRAIVDLKSFSNKTGAPISRAIEKAIAAYRYNLQVVIYDEAVEAAKALIRARGNPVIHGTPEQIEWATRWADIKEPPAFLFVFQQTGNAPVARGRRMPRGMVFDVTRRAAETLKFKWVACAETFGCDPWLDIEPIDDIDDEAIPLWATEF